MRYDVQLAIARKVSTALSVREQAEFDDLRDKFDGALVSLHCIQGAGTT